MKVSSGKAPMEDFIWKPKLYRLQFEQAWEDFDRELEKLLKKGKFRIDPKTKEIVRVTRPKSKLGMDFSALPNLFGVADGCPVCGLQISPSDEVLHHISYNPPRVVRVHRRCHHLIHFTDIFLELRPRDRRVQA